MAAVFEPIRSSGQEPDSTKTAISPLRNNDFCRISVVKTRQTKVVSGNRKKAPAPVTPDRRKAPGPVTPAGTTECAGSGGEDLGGVPPPTEYGKESGQGSQHASTLTGTANLIAPRIPPGRDVAKIRHRPPELDLQGSPWGTAISRSELNKFAVPVRVLAC